MAREPTQQRSKNLIGHCAWPNWLLLVLLLGLGIPTSLYADDAYMDAINAEADQLSVDPRSTDKKRDVQAKDFSQNGWSNQAQSMDQDLPPRLKRNEFEEALKTSFYGSYMFYKRLDEQDQFEVYDLYTQNPSIELVRKRIMDLKKEALQSK